MLRTSFKTRSSRRIRTWGSSRDSRSFIPGWFGWEFEERTRTRYESAKEGEYIQFLGSRAIGYEIEQIAHEENPIAVMKALEEQGWLKVLNPKWTVAKADVPELAQLLKTRATMAEFNIGVDAAPAVMHFLTSKLSDADVSTIQKLIPHREFVSSWKRLESDAKELSKKLLSKEAALNSGAWKILSSAKPEALLYLDVTGGNKAVDEKIKNFFGKWRQVQEKIPVAQMAEMRITPQLPEYPQIWQEAFLLLLDGKLRSEGEILKFLAPFEPPLPPPPPTPVRRGRAAAKKASASVPKAAVQETSTAPVESANTPPVDIPAVRAKATTEKKAHKKPVVSKPSPVTKAKPAGKSTAKPVSKSKVKPAKPQVKVVAKKTASNPPKKGAAKTSKSPSKAGKQVKPVAKSSKTKVSVKKPKSHAPEKKKHGLKSGKPEKKQQKRR